MRTKNEELIPCPKCLGGGDLPGPRLGHPAMVSSRRCWFCQGAKMVTKEKASEFTP